MPIVYAAVVPHSPLLIPAVAKDHARLLQETQQALAGIGTELYASQSEILILLTPHGPSIEGVVVLHVADRFQGQLKEFGDLTTSVTAEAALETAQRLKHLAEERQLDVRLQTDEQLDYGSTVPLFTLLRSPAQPKLLPMTVTGWSPDQVVRAAAVLREVLTRSKQRCAVIASADLLRRQSTEALESVQRPQSLERTLSSAITAVDPSSLAADGEPEFCGRQPILLLLLSLQGLATTGTILSFEAPLGVGLLTASFHLDR